ncbi:MAG: tetratricopeptide repeat protein [Deltaproteobacteria bacterium]|nr:tetratricopeptide repeat protein [Deltaproteobacteria bacterium]
MSIGATAVGIALLSLVSVGVDRLLAQTSSEDSQYDPFEGEEFTPEEESADGGRLRAEELEEEPLAEEGNEEEEGREQERAPVMPRDFSTSDSLHLPERFPEEELEAPPVAIVPNAESIEEPPVMSSEPPTLPVVNTLPPHEQLALHFIESGVEALSRDDFEQAQEDFEQALEIAPMQPFGYYFLGRLAFARGEHKTALVFLRKADVVLARGDQVWRGEAARLRGAVYEDMRDYGRAHAAYRQSLQLTPTNLRAASALARLAGEEQDTRAAFPR